jgi:N6-adenosine-specific RNA methylase IME4
MRFRTILADPPWVYRAMGKNPGRAGGLIKNPAQIYGGIPTDALCKLPVSAIAEKDAALILWATWPCLEDALQVINTWGFDYKTGLPWVKMTRAAAPKRGIGFHHAGCSELLLIATRGKNMCPSLHGPKPIGVLFHPAGRHSAKPEDAYEIVERYGSPFLEMFARPDGGLFPTRPGWTRIGNEITGRDIVDDLRLLAESEK